MRRSAGWADRACQVKASKLLLEHFDDPKVVLRGFVGQILKSDDLLADLVREADTEWGRELGERPHLEREAQPVDPDDPYTLASVRQALTKLVEAASSGAK